MIWAKELENGYFDIKMRPDQAKSIGSLHILCLPHIHDSHVVCRNGYQVE